MWLHQKRSADEQAAKRYKSLGVYQRFGVTQADKQKSSFTKALPPRLKLGMEKLTGVNLEDVQVHYNSPKPAMVQAHAYAQGKDIYLAPGQEHNLPHELGHIAQQALGLVKATTEVNGVPVNDDPNMEQQATEWGKIAGVLGYAR